MMAVIALTAQSLWADTLWTGAIDDDFNTAGNWTNGVPGATNPGWINSGTVSVDSTINADITQNGGLMFLDSSQNFSGAGRTHDVLGGTLRLASGGNQAMRISGILNLNGGVMDAPVGIQATDGFQIMNAAGEVNFIGGTHDLDVGRIWNEDGAVLLDGATLYCGNIWLGDFTATATSYPSLTLRDGSTLSGSGDLRFIGNDYGTIVFESGANTMNMGNMYGGSVPSIAEINFLPGSVGSTMTVTGYTDWATAYANGDLLYDGSNADSFASRFSVSGETLTLIPEPGTMALMLTGVLGLLLRRRFVGRC